ncbi:MAG: fibronectin type III domain-containing protein [Oscillospiraceae bacterium]|jgi:hypothetical protein|nr:fibronectin type III domain-containing protein [Oscillospiraceae bacterium]
MQFELRGIPCVTVSSGTYSAVAQYAIEDRAIPTMRRVKLPSLPYSKAFTGNNVTYMTRKVVEPELDYILAALVDPLNDYERNTSASPAGGWMRDPYYIPGSSAEALAAYSAGGFSAGFTGGIRGMDPSKKGQQNTPDNRIKNTAAPTGTGAAGPGENPYHANFDYPNSWYPSNTYPQSVKESGMAATWNILEGDDLGPNGDVATDTITFTGVSDADVYKQFQEYAQDYYFRDGLPLIPPTRKLVDKMLAATDRAPDEVIGGKITGRLGVPTVEKVAINAVMCGAKPEYFPVILAAIEGYAGDLENRQEMFHALTSGGAFGYHIYVSGPIVKEIGMNSGAGFFGSGNQASNTIGRAFRMCMLTLGHNWLGYIDTPRTGRLNETTFWVVGENEDAIPDGWKTLREQMGFSKDQNTITVHASSRAVSQTNDATGVDVAWTPLGVIDALRVQPDRSNNANMVILPPAQAAALKEVGFNSVDTLRQNTGTGVAGYPNGVGNGNNVPNPNALLTWIIVAGEDPGRAHSTASNTHTNAISFQTTLITGAPLNPSVKDPAVPGTPQNFKVVQGAAPGTADLSWEPPADRPGVTRAPIHHYEVTAQYGDMLERWVIVPGGPTARSTTLARLDGGKEYVFRVRAVSGDYTQSPTTMYYWGGSRIPHTNGVGTWGTGVNQTTTNVYTSSDIGANAFGTGGNSTMSLNPQAGIGAIASIHWSDPSLVGNGVKPTGPSEVFFIKAYNEGTSGIRVEWRVPYSNGGSAITSYDYSTDNGATWRPMNATNGSGYAAPYAIGASAVSAGKRMNGSYIITARSSDGAALVSGTIYDILVRAVKAVGYGTYSGQTAQQGATTAWPFQTHHRGPAAAALFAGTPAANSTTVQNNSRVRVTMP